MRQEVWSLRGLISSETNWSRGAIWDIDGEPQFQCGECSSKTLKKFTFENTVGALSDEEYKIYCERVTSEAIEVPAIPGKYAAELYTKEIESLFYLREGGMLKCERCGKIVI